MPDDRMTIWTIFYGATNHPPGKWVVRAFDSMRDGTVRPHELIFECDSLVEARCKVPLGLTRGEPNPADDRAIVEVWF